MSQTESSQLFHTKRAPKVAPILPDLKVLRGLMNQVTFVLMLISLLKRGWAHSGGTWSCVWAPAQALWLWAPSP